MPHIRPRPLRTAAAIAVLAVATVTTASCSTTPAGGTGAPGAAANPKSGSNPTAASSPTGDVAGNGVTLKTNVDEGATVPVDTQVTVNASNGTISTVAMTYKDPKTGDVNVEGKTTPDASSWTASSLLEPGMTYRLSMTGRASDGSEATTERTFSTSNLSKKQQVFPTIAGNKMTVGVAMPVVVTFDVPVADRAAFQKKMTVTSQPAQEGSWSWISNKEVHWRPKEYWQPGTKVEVDVDINGVNAGNGNYGQISAKASFTVGSATIIKADLASHQMTVLVNGAVAKTLPITGGKPGWDTRSGTKVLMEKFDTLKMDATTIGVDKNDPNYYSISDVRYAMRETNSGEFIHAAPWSVGSQGRANVSHGCIGLSTGNAGWLFEAAKVGDPIIVSGTTRTLEKGNGWTDWNISYEEFKKGSAL